MILETQKVIQRKLLQRKRSSGNTHNYRRSEKIKTEVGTAKAKLNLNKAAGLYGILIEILSAS